MSRVEKGTRIKNLPPIIQMDEKDSKGDLPTKLRIASDNRLGKAPVFFDDTKALDFVQNVKQFMLPAGLVSGNQYIVPEITSSLYTTGTVVRGIGDYFVTGSSEQKDLLTPYNECYQFALDNTHDPFYITGSKVEDIGEGFTAPLWSKTKVEIDISPLTPCSFSIENFTSNSNNYPMAYWNKDRKVWEGAGALTAPNNGREFGCFFTSSAPTAQYLFNSESIGFSGGLLVTYYNMAEYWNLFGLPTNTYGFPWNEKYYATSSNCISMKNYITEPFLVEKVVLEFSGSYTNNHVFSNPVASYNTFFILNQRYLPLGSVSHTEYLINLYYNNIVSSSLFAFSKNAINYSRDLVTWLEVAAFNDSAVDVSSFIVGDINYTRRELNLFSKTNAEWSGRYVVSGVVKSPNPYNYGDTTSWSTCSIAPAEFVTYMNAWPISGRSGLPVPNGREYVTSFATPETAGSFAHPYSGLTIPLDKRYVQTNPYLLLPTDNLILGWQVPYFNVWLNVLFNLGTAIYQGQGPCMKFDAAPAKLTLYGSTIREGVECHDTINQELTAPNISEEIGG
jgi:hypothetical protein